MGLPHHQQKGKNNGKHPLAPTKKEGKKTKETFPHRLRPESSLLHPLSRVRPVPDLLPGPALNGPSPGEVLRLFDDRGLASLSPPG